MASQAELQLLLTAKDAASATVRAVAGAISGALVGALSEAARAGADLTASQVRLEVAANNTTGGIDAYTAALVAAQEVARSYGFSTIEINDALALLTEQTGSVGAAMDRLQVAENLSRGAHIDLYTASKLLGKATDENANTLGRYGIVIKHGADVTEMLAAVQAKFGGQAEAYGNTTAGAIAKTTVAIDDFKGAIGNSLGPAQQYIALLPGLSAGLTLVSSAAALASPELKAFTASAAAAALPILAVAAAIVLVTEALLQVKETIDVVVDHWDVFIYALTTGQLNDIPIFGFFFQKAQQVLGVLQGIMNLWNSVSAAFSGNAASMAPAADMTAAGYNQYAEGTPSVPYTQLALVHKNERIISAEDNARGNWGGGLTVNVVVPGNIYGMDDFGDKVTGIIRDAVLRGGLRGVVRA